MVRLGQMSFAFYLWHFLVIMWLAHLFKERQQLSTAGNLGFIFLCLAVVVLLSWATFRWVEMPMMRKFASPRRRPLDAAPSADRAARPAPLAEQVERQQR
jgi:peptidoglycan/LPS O-acetylase OafA/YrhL